MKKQLFLSVFFLLFFVFQGFSQNFKAIGTLGREQIYKEVTDQVSFFDGTVITTIQSRNVRDVQAFQWALGLGFQTKVKYSNFWEFDALFSYQKKNLIDLNETVSGNYKATYFELMTSRIMRHKENDTKTFTTYFAPSLSLITNVMDRYPSDPSKFELNKRIYGLVAGFGYRVKHNRLKPQHFEYGINFKILRIAGVTSEVKDPSLTKTQQNNFNFDFDMGLGARLFVAYNFGGKKKNDKVEN